MAPGRPVDDRRGRAAPSRRCRPARSTATSRRSASASARSPIPATSRACLPDSVAALAGLDIWILDALRYTPHPSHFSVAEALDWIERLKPRRAILTNLHTDLDYDDAASKAAGACGAGLRRPDDRTARQLKGMTPV